MKKLLFLLLCGAAFSQGVRYDLPPVLNSHGIPIANPLITLCTGTASISGSVCTGTAQSVTDITGLTQCPSGSPVTLTNSNVCRGTGDSLGNAGFWLSPGAYIYCVNAPSTTGSCYNLVAPVGATSAGAPSMPSATITGALTAGKSNGVINAAQQTGGDIGTQINNAITALAGCGAVYIPSGSYTLSTTVAVASCVEIYGDGIGKTIINAPSLTTGNHMFSSTNKTDWTIRDMTLIGPSPSGATDVRGISAVGCTRCKATRLRVTNLTDGIDMLNGASTSSDNIISENYILSMSNQGSAVLGDRNKIINNTIDTVGTTNQHHGIYLQAGVGNEVIGNQVQNISGFCVHNFTIATSGIITASRIANNYCNNAGTAGSGTRGCFAFAEQTPATGSRSGEIVGNTCENTTASTQFYISASDSVVVNGNTARNYQGDCIDVQGSTGGFVATRIIVSNNICFSGTVSGAAAIHILPNSGSVINITVTDNIIDTAFGIGIWVQACSDCIISRNRIKDYNSGGSASNSGIFLDASTVRNIVTLNQISTVNVTGTPFAILTQNSTVTDSLIEDNILLNNSQVIADNGLRNVISGNKTSTTLGVHETQTGISYCQANGVICDASLFRAAAGLIQPGGGGLTGSAIILHTGNKALLTGDFTSLNSAGLQVITGLSFALPSFAANYAFHCSLTYSQATAVAGDQFGVASLTTAPTQLHAWSHVITTEGATAVQTTGDSGAIINTTPTSIVTFTPVGTGIKQAEIDGSLEAAGGGASTLQFYVTNGTAADLIVIKRDSYCLIY